MCYPKPGPRCSNHASIKLKSARDAVSTSPTEQNRQLLSEAENAYALTPAGINKLRSSGMNEVDKGNMEYGVSLIKQADANESKRERLIEASTLLAKLEGLQSHYKYRSLAESELSPEVVAHLATDGTVEDRGFIATHPSTPADTLTQLSVDEVEHVRFHVAHNPLTPAETLSRLSGDTDSGVRQNVARNPSTTESVLSRLAQDDDNRVRFVVAQNPKTSAKALSLLMDDVDREVAAKVLKNPNVPSEVLFRVAKSDEPGFAAHARELLWRDRPDAIADHLNASRDVEGIKQLRREHPSQLESMLGWN